MQSSNHVMLLASKFTPDLTNICFYRLLHQNLTTNQNKNLSGFMVQKSDRILQMVEGSKSDLSVAFTAIKQDPRLYETEVLIYQAQEQSSLKHPLVFMDATSMQSWRYKDCFKDSFDFGIFIDSPREAYRLINNLARFTNQDENYQAKSFKKNISKKIQRAMMDNQSLAVS